ncbi:MAG: PspC domain-containing protein [Betaproteobacteria bacterium]|nr:PspC domain-containing protein [Betaproteobacteria bacterium]
MPLTLSKNRMIGGVCGGLAEWLGWDPTLVRILYTLITIFTAFSGALIYLVIRFFKTKGGKGSGCGKCSS